MEGRGSNTEVTRPFSIPPLVAVLRLLDDEITDVEDIVDQSDRRSPVEFE
jgi:hypothetical protein